MIRFLPTLRSAGLILVALTGLVRSGFGQSDTLEPFVVTATRTPADIRTLGSDVEVITSAEIDREQLSSFANALQSIPGTVIAPNGPTGSDASIFLRGANSDQTLFLVDGIRMNDANTDYAVFLGAARLGSNDVLEVAEGPQSTLYGSEASGGVVSIRTQPGSGQPSGTFSAEAGSFGTLDSTLSAQGALNGWGYSASLSADHTKNQRANNESDSADVAFRLDRFVSPLADVGVTLRGFETRYQDPGDIFTNSPDDYETESNWLATVFADLHPSKDWAIHAILGGQDRRYWAYDVSPYSAPISVVKNERGVADVQATYSGLPRQQVTVGATAETTTTVDTGYGSIDNRQRLGAVFAEDQWHPQDSLYFTGGIRYDDFDTFGSATTARATAAWLTAGRSLKFRASYGTGFNAPSFLELYGVADGYVGNPTLRPERSEGGDAGVDYYLAGGRGTLSATVFRTDYTNLIEYDFNAYPGTTENVDKARTSGLELEAKVTLGTFKVHAFYTYLEATDLTEQIRLLRRPRSSGGADVWRDFGHGLSAGLGVNVVAGRQDVDASTYLTVNEPDYTVARIYGRWQATPRLALKARIENALDEKYQPVDGYPALGFGAFGGVEIKL